MVSIMVSGSGAGLGGEDGSRTTRSSRSLPLGPSRTRVIPGTVSGGSTGVTTFPAVVPGRDPIHGTMGRGLERYQNLRGGSVSERRNSRRSAGEADSRRAESPRSRWLPHAESATWSSWPRSASRVSARCGKHLRRQDPAHHVAERGSAEDPESHRQPQDGGCGQLDRPFQWECSSPTRRRDQFGRRHFPHLEQGREWVAARVGPP